MKFKKQNYLLSEKELDIRVITIPKVKKNMLSNLLLNELKKVSVKIDVNDSIIDYEIIQKSKTTYKIIAFITRKKKIQSNYHYITSYHILQKIAENYNQRSAFIVPFVISSGNFANKIYALYIFDNGLFVKREILFENDLAKINSNRLFWVDIFRTNDDSRPLFRKVTVITTDEINMVKSSIKKKIFRQKKFGVVNYIGMLFVLITTMAIIGVGFKVLFFSTTISKMKKRINILDRQLLEQEKDIKKSRINYQTYIKLQSQKSKINWFFNSLYCAVNNNAKITRVVCNKRDSKIQNQIYNFTIEGECNNDQKLENNFRKNLSWQKVSFAFVKKEKKINFVIRGEFKYE